MLIIPSLIFGILSAIFALIIELAVDLFFSVSLAEVPNLPHDLHITTLIALLGIAGIEESSKYLFLRLRIKRFPPAPSSAMWKNIVLGASFGIGFAVIEILLMFFSNFGFLPLWITLGTATLHITTSIIFAIFLFAVSQTHFARFSAVALAIFLHMLYNVFVFFWPLAY